MIPQLTIHSPSELLDAEAHVLLLHKTLARFQRATEKLHRDLLLLERGDIDADEFGQRVEAHTHVGIDVEERLDDTFQAMSKAWEFMSA